MKTLTVLLFTLFAGILNTGNQKQKAGGSVMKDLFGTHNGKEVYLLTLTVRTTPIFRLQY